MYNYYTYEKKAKDELEKEKQKSQKDILHKNLTERLVNNYNTRIQKFVLDMVKNPTIITDYVNPIGSTRKQLMAEFPGKIDGRKEFGFNAFITDKERIKHYLSQNHRGIHNDNDLNNAVNRETNQRTSHIPLPKTNIKSSTTKDFYINNKRRNHHNHHHFQRNMSNKSASVGDISSLLGHKCPDDKRQSCINDDDENNRLEKINQLANGSTAVSQGGNKNNKQRNDHGNNIKEGYNSQQYKTHFKAAMYLAENYNYKRLVIPDISTNDLSKGDTNSSLRQHYNPIQNRRQGGFRNIFSSTFHPNLNRNKLHHRNNQDIKMKQSASLSQLFKASTTSYLYKKYNQNDNNDKEQYKAESFILDQFSQKFPINEDNIDLVESNPLLYNLDFHSIKNINVENASRINRNDADNQKKLDYLKQLTFEIDEQLKAINKKRTVNDVVLNEENSNSSSNNNNNNNAKSQGKPILTPLPLASLCKPMPDLVNHHKAFRYDDKTILVDNERIDKTRYDLIAKKILRKCNYSHGKNQNNNTSLKKGEGKLMITSGMTVNEFAHKYLNKKAL